MDILSRTPLTSLPLLGCIKGDVAYLLTSGANVVEFIIDAEDAEKVLKTRWFANTAGYITSTDPDNGQKILLHRLVMGVTDSSIILDHINRLKYDNRKSNLRVVTQEVNAWNRSIYSNTTNTGIKGITRISNKFTKSTYYKVVTRREKVNYIPSFVEAIKVKLDLEIKYCGEHAPLLGYDIDSIVEKR
jgi:hypothetical protein